MKKNILLLFLAAATVSNTYAQNTFPASGNVGIGTITPAAPLQVIGASRFGSTANYGGFDASGNFSFSGTSAYRVGDNKFVFRSATNLKSGLYYDATNLRYEFRSNTGTSIFTIGTTTGIVGVRGVSNANYALNINASATYNGINVTDPVNNYAFYSVKNREQSCHLRRK